jgi:acyl transferase domain-containing protein/SAM-dependent methyltransferase
MTGAAPDYAALLQRATRTIERLKEQLAAGGAKAPIAIVGMASRLPGAEAGPAALWDLLVGGRDGLSTVPPDRWNAEAYTPGHEGKPAIASSRGGFVGDLRMFDADFFGISPREARSLDPQQRLLLELAWHALEHAQIPASMLAGSNGGVFVGISSADYQQMLAARSDGEIDAYQTSGTTHSTAAGRLAFALDLRGPAISLDTACSSSLVALHTACRSLSGGECDLALVGGVNRIISPVAHINFTRAGMLSPHGRCATFADEADGYVRAEGGAMFVLKRLADAERDGDRILALIPGSAVNHDGRSSGLTVPNGPAQEAVIRAALKAARLGPADISYVEAHGTGTSLGDPIEAASLGRVFADRESRLMIGSVKANIGHLEAAAGAAGLVKLVLALRARTLPGQVHFQTPSRRIDWAELPLRVVDRATPWPTGEVGRAAGISSFGFSGTNAHAVVTEAPAVLPAAAPGQSGPLILPVSARDSAALKMLARAHAERLRTLPAEDIAAYCRTAAAGRDHMDLRAAVVGSDGLELAGAIEAAADRAVSGSHRPRRIAFLFSGQGTLRDGMGKALYEDEPAFRASIDRCDEHLAPLLGVGLTGLLWGEQSDRSNDTCFAQPVLTAFHIALVETWRSWGVEPAGVSGHSVGEIAASWCAGALGLEDALTLAFERGAAMAGTEAMGAMLAVLAPEEDVVALIGDSGLEIAANNGSDNVVVSGDAAEIEKLSASAAAANISCRRLTCDRAFHSRHMESALAPFAAHLARLGMRAPQSALFVSTVTGAVEAEAIVTADYWQRQIRGKVRFGEAVETLRERGFDTFVEIGPGTALTSILRRRADPRLATIASCAGEGDTARFRLAVCDLYEKGISIDWRRRMRGGASHLDLPSYPFQRREYWAAPENARRVEGEPVPAAATKMAYAVEWRDSPLFDAPEGVVDAAALGRLAQARRQALGDRAITMRLAQYMAFEDRLETLSARFVAQAFSELGVEFEREGRFSTDSLAKRVGVVQAHRRLFGRMLAILAEEGIIKSAGNDHWSVASVAEAKASSTAFSGAERAGQVEYRLLDRCGKALARVITGRVEPLELLFPGGDSSDVQELYREGPLLNALNGAISALAADMAALASPARGLRILEIGAGTGGSTRAILKALPETGIEYWFTDVSPLLVDRAKDEFGMRSGIRFATLDVERPLGAQGLPAGGFDIVIASNVLHATRHLDETLRNVATALKPGGALLMIEGVRPLRWVDLTFGLTEGWWRFTDTDRRPDYPLLSAEGWETALADAGLAAAEAIVPLQDAAQNVIVAHRPLDAADPASRCWIVLGDGQADGVAGALSEALRRSGRPVIEVEPGTAYVRDGGRCRLDPWEAGQWRSLLDGVGRAPIVVHAWCCDSAAEIDEPASAESLCLGLAKLGQAIADHGAGTSLWILAPASSEEAGFIAGSAVSAEALCIGFDLEGTHVRCIAVTPDVRPEMILAECATVAESRTRLSAGGRAVARLAPADLADSGFRADPQAAYLITGGLGGAGLETARWLVSRGARSLVLAGRSTTAAEQHAPAIDTLERSGASIHLRAADVGDAAQVERLVAEFGAGLPPLRGIFHAAGVIGPLTPIQALDDETILDTLRSKVRGGGFLHEATRHLTLDAFVLFSSGASLWGFRGESHYAAANGYLDALAARRAGEGLAASVINWGFLSFGGMTRDAESRALLRNFGVDAIEGRDFDAALAMAVGAGPTQLIFANNDWDRMSELFAVRGADALFAELADTGAAPAAAAPAQAGTAPAPPAFQDQVARQPEARRADFVEQMVLDELAHVLGTRAADLAAVRDRGFLAMGMDSLMAIDYRRRIEVRTGLALPATLIFDHRAPADLADHLARLISSKAAPAPAGPAPAPASPPGPPPPPASESSHLRQQLEELLED